jgi:acylphosphatase
MMSFSPSDAETVRRKLIYHGRVQGVGFRYTTASIAWRHAVAGYVRNLPDGTVELAVVGSRQDIEAFLNDVQQTFDANITSIDAAELKSGEAFRGFEIRR